MTTPDSNQRDAFQILIIEKLNLFRSADVRPNESRVVLIIIVHIMSLF